MIETAKLVHELRVGDVLIADVLPSRVVESLTPTGDMVLVQSTGTDGGRYDETLLRDRVVTIGLS